MYENLITFIGPIVMSPVRYIREGVIKSIRSIKNRFRISLINWLEKSHDTYEQRIYNNMPKLYKHIRKGDVILVEGRSQMSRIVKLFSQSHWSHSAFYIKTHHAPLLSDPSPGFRSLTQF